MANPRQRIAILGAGIAARDHARAVMHLGHDVVAASTRSSDSPRWAAFKQICPGTRHIIDGEVLLAAPDVDAVIACLPWNVMGDWLERLLACPKPVLLEKPIALDAQTIRDALERPGVSLDGKIVGYNRRHYEGVRQLKERLGQGGLKAADIRISENIARLIELFGAEIVPHILAYSSSHGIDLALYLLGALSPVAISAHRSENGFTSYNGLMKTDDGTPVSLAVNADDPTPMGIRCLFDDGSAWELAPLERLCVTQGHTVIEPTPENNIRRYVGNKIHDVIENTSFKPGLVAQMTCWLSRKKGPSATPTDSLSLLNTIENIRNAAHAGL